MSDPTADLRDYLSFPPAPAITAEQAGELARRTFGLDAVAASLDGEQDRNFHLVDAGKRHFVMKFSDASDRALIELQNAALDHIATVDAGCIVPRVIRDLKGRGLVCVASDGQTACYARILSFVQGRSIGELGLGNTEFWRIGAAIARLDTALSSFVHGATRGAMIWNIGKAREARPLLELVQDPEDRGLAERTLDRFEEREDELPALRAQFVHHDLNPSNVIALGGTEGSGYGFIDFGDFTLAPLIGELAVAAAYNVAAEGHPLSAIRCMLSGYASVTPLLDEEVGLLPTLIAVRLAQSLAISRWRAKITPKNSAYLLRYGAKASRDLRRLAQLSEEEARAYLSDR